MQTLYGEAGRAYICDGITAAAAHHQGSPVDPALRHLQRRCQYIPAASGLGLAVAVLDDLTAFDRSLAFEKTVGKRAAVEMGDLCALWRVGGEVKGGSSCGRCWCLFAVE